MDFLFLRKNFPAFAVPVVLVALAHKLLSKRTASLQRNEEVFLNFRSIDTGEGFADHLYRSLINARIRVFRDEDEIRAGESLIQAQAVRGSKILIPIISENYASNKWCLNVLVEMMKCKKRSGHIVLPVFYKVSPADARHQTGSFGEAFRYHSESFDEAIVEGWKEALREVGSLRGWEVAEGDEGQLVELVVRKVLIELKKLIEPVITENSAGIEGPMRKIMDFVDSHGSTLYVGIYGEGGVGKTTLAKVIYNKLSERFDHCSFIPNVRKSSECNRIKYLQKQLIWDLGKIEVNEGQLTATISSSFKSKKVLIVLDDVNTNDQLKDLAGERNCFAPGSRIIITTREVSILEWAQVDHRHEHKAMEEYEAKNLFARHAFRRDSPPSEFSDLSDEVVSIVRGFPLILEIVGSYLCGKSRASWENAKRTLQPLQHSQNSQEWLEKILEIVYSKLNVEQRKIFLDIACFLVGSDARIASYMWDTSDFNPVLGIEELISMSLIKIGDNHELTMHDELRDFGRGVVRGGHCNEPDNGSRLWVHEEAVRVLGKNEGIANTQGLSLHEGSSEIIQYTNEQFEKLVNLRFLRVSDADFVGDFDEIFSQLRWLQWERCPDNLEAKKFAVGELAVLDLSRSKISDNWSGWQPIMLSAKKLKVLNLTGCDSLENTFFLSDFKHLEILILRNCEKLTNISSIGELKTLVSLDLRGCSGLKELPEGVENLGGLKELFLDQTLIGEIRDITSLVKLQRLSLQRCRRVTLCRDSFLKLESLTELVLSDTKITELPESIGDLQNLEILKIRGIGIKKLEDCIGSLRKLRELDASGCKELKEVTGRIHELSSLQSLDLRHCAELQKVPKLPSKLTVVSVTCKSRELPSFSHLIHLKQLRLHNCKSLKYIPELPPTTLELEMSGCVSLEFLTPQKAVKDFKVSLKRLDIIRCESLEKLNLSHLSLLRVLRALDCTKLHEIGGLHKLDRLESLTILEDTSIELDKPFSSFRNRHLTEHIEMMDLPDLEDA